MTLILVLEDIISSTALWADNICLEQLQGDPMRSMTIKQLDDLQHVIGVARMRARAILLDVKYEGESNDC